MKGLSCEVPVYVKYGKFACVFNTITLGMNSNVNEKLKLYVRQFRLERGCRGCVFAVFGSAGFFSEPRLTVD